MHEMLKQIEDLAKQIEVLTSKVINLEEIKEDTANHLDVSLYLQEAEESPFQYHEVTQLDEYVKSHYMRMLLTVFDYTVLDLENRYQFAAKIYVGLHMETAFSLLLQQSKKLTVADVKEFVSIAKEYDIIPHFVMDLLMLTSIEKEPALLQHVAEVVSTLSIEEAAFKQYCQLATAILEVNHDGIHECLMKHQQLRHAVGHYLMVMKSNFAPEIIIEGTGEEIITINNLHTKRLHLKNVCIEILDKEMFKDYEELVLENCTFKGNHVALHFRNIRLLTLRNVQFTQVEQVSSIRITQCEDVIIENLKLKNLRVHGTYLCVIKYVQNLIVRNCLFEAIELVEKNFEERVVLMKIKEVKEVTKHNVKLNQCKSGVRLRSSVIHEIL